MGTKQNNKWPDNVARYFLCWCWTFRGPFWVIWHFLKPSDLPCVSSEPVKRLQKAFGKGRAKLVEVIGIMDPILPCSHQLVWGVTAHKCPRQQQAANSCCNNRKNSATVFPRLVFKVFTRNPGVIFSNSTNVSINFYTACKGIKARMEETSTRPQLWVHWLQASVT